MSFRNDLGLSALLFGTEPPGFYTPRVRPQLNAHGKLPASPAKRAARQRQRRARATERRHRK